MIQFFKRKNGEGGEKVVLPNGVTFKSSTFTDGSFLNSLDFDQITSASSLFNNCKKFISPNGFTISLANATDCQNTFNGCSALSNITVSVPKTDKIGNMFNGCTNLVTVNIVTSAVLTGSFNAFSGCTKLQNVNEFDISNVTSMSNMFNQCTALSNESLNNILSMCSNNSKSYDKTLKGLGLTQEQAEICQTLSNWNAFVSAGWSAGSY